MDFWLICFIPEIGIIPIEISKAAFMVVHFSRLIARVHTKNLDVVTTTPSLFCISRAQLYNAPNILDRKN